MQMPFFFQNLFYVADNFLYFFVHLWQHKLHEGGHDLLKKLVG